MKKYFFSLFVFLIFSSPALTHVSHYKDLKFLKYGLFLNDKLIGSHIFELSKKGSYFSVKSKGEFKVSKLGVLLMNYKTESEEVYKKGKLMKFNSKTNQNDKEKFANIVSINENSFFIDGSSYKGEIDNNAIVGSWWNHEIVSNSKQISPISGRIIEQKVKFIGKESISINGNSYSALHFHFFSNDNEPMNKKKLNIHVWYDSKSLLWIKSRYEKFGTWEYRLNQAG